MNSTMERLFETYGEAVLEETGHGFDEQRLKQWLETFPLHEKTRYHILDGLFDYYQHWAAASFTAGFSLGFSLSNDQVRRSGPQQG